MTLREEDVDRVGLPEHQPQLLSTRRQLDGCRGCLVRAAQVDGKAIVDEHPGVVVALKSKLLILLVDEVLVCLERKVKVVLIPLVSKELVVDRKEGAPAILVKFGTAGHGRKRQGDSGLHGHIRIVIPLVEGRFTRGRRRTVGPAHVHGRAVGAQDWSNDAPINPVPVVPLHVRV